MTEATKYDWKSGGAGAGQPASGGGPLEVGYHYLRVTKVLRTRGGHDERGYEDRNGPTMMVVWQDDDGREGTNFLGCYEALAWKILRLASCAGVDLDTWTEAGYTPDHFADEAFANARLVGLQTWARVYESEYKGRKRIEIEPVRSEDLPTEVDTTKARNISPPAPTTAPTTAPDPAPAPAPATIREEDIPF